MTAEQRMRRWPSNAGGGVRAAAVRRSVMMNREWTQDFYLDTCQPEYRLLFYIIHNESYFTSFVFRSFYSHAK
jgi:hypothetical protein